MILLKYPNHSNLPERSWVANIVLSRLFDNFVLEPENRQDWSISLITEPSKGQKITSELTLPDNFFRKASKSWLKPGSFPQLPLVKWQLESLDKLAVKLSDSLPILYGTPSFNVDAKGNGHLAVDVFGSAFFMLSRYEELVIKERDEHDRFSAKTSLAYQDGFLTRPIVDEYIELLWSCMGQIWQNLKRKQFVPKTFVSCDVDTPYDRRVKSLGLTTLQSARDVLLRHTLKKGMNRFENYFKTVKGDYSVDPNNTFDWIMEVNEKAGNRVAFYFITDESHKSYSIKEPRIRALLRHIHDRGHEIGLHCGYDSYQNGTQIKNEAEILRLVLEEEKIDVSNFGVRMHYLRWDTAITPCYLDATGLNYDATLGYADHAGFRCGTCHEYPMFDLIGQKPLKLIQRPLVMMDCSILGENYMGLKPDGEAQGFMKELRSVCYMVNGCFSILWHNSSLKSQIYKDMYLRVITECCL